MIGEAANGPRVYRCSEQFGGGSSHLPAEVTQSVDDLVVIAQGELRFASGTALLRRRDLV